MKNLFLEEEEESRKNFRQKFKQNKFNKISK